MSLLFSKSFHGESIFSGINLSKFIFHFIYLTSFILFEFQIFLFTILRNLYFAHFVFAHMEQNETLKRTVF